MSGIDVSKLMEPKEPEVTLGARASLALRRIFSGVGLKKLEIFYFQLATMLNAGVSIRDALHTLADQQGGRAGRVYRDVADQVDQGETLSHAMAVHPEVFDSLAVAMAKTGEMTGRLDENLKLVGATIERIRDMRSRIVTGLIYPIILLHMAALIPNLVVLIKEGFVPFIVNVVSLLAPVYGLILLAWFTHQVLRETKGYGEFLLGMVYFGGVVRKVALSRFSRNLAALYDAGVPLDRAVETAGATCGNGAFGEEFRAVAKKLKTGTGLTVAMQSAKRIPPLVHNMIQTGEHSGSLEETLRKVAEYYEFEAATSIRRMCRVIPILGYLLIAGAIAWKVITFWVNYYGPLIGG